MPRSRTCSRPAPTWCSSTSPGCRRGPRRRRRYGLKALDRALEGVTGTTAVHLCFGYAQMVKGKPSGLFVPARARPLAGAADLDRGGAAEARSRGAQGAAVEDHHSRACIDLSRPPLTKRAETVADAHPRGARRSCRRSGSSIAPDCGMKYLPREVAFGKMRAMVEGATIVRRELTAPH